MSTLEAVQYIGGYHEYIGRCSVHWRNNMSTSGAIMSTLGDVQYIRGYHDAYGGYNEYIGGYHEYIRRIL